MKDYSSSSISLSDLIKNSQRRSKVSGTSISLSDLFSDQKHRTYHSTLDKEIERIKRERFQKPEDRIIKNTYSFSGKVKIQAGWKDKARIISQKDFLRKLSDYKT